MVPNLNFLEKYIEFLQSTKHFFLINNFVRDFLTKEFSFQMFAIFANQYFNIILRISVANLYNILG